MFKSKNYFTSITLLATIFQKHITVYKNIKLNYNCLNIKGNKNFKFPPLNYLVEFDKINVVDLAAQHNTGVNTTQVNNIYYSYKWDCYINNIEFGYSSQTQSKFYYNRAWLEREVSEFFGFTYKNSIDTRPLLLNYDENLPYLLKNQSQQSEFELKTIWHSRKIQKTNQKNVEL